MPCRRTRSPRCFERPIPDVFLWVVAEDDPVPAPAAAPPLSAEAVAAIANDAKTAAMPAERIARTRNG
jgi:hypothetical protein